MRSHASFADWELNLLGIRSYHSEKGGQDEIPRVRRGRARGIFWWHLLKGGADVTFLVRPKRAAQLQRDGLVVKAQDGEIRTPAKAIQQDQLQGAYDVILLCCKVYDLDGAMAAIAPAMGDHSVIVPLLNGVRHIDAATRARRAHHHQCRTDAGRN